MIRALRRSRLITLLAVFTVFTAMPASLPLWHDEGDDPACAPQLVVHDHGAHRVEAHEPAPTAPEHCLLCHWAQSFRHATTASRFVLPEAPSALLAGVEVSALATTVTSGPSGRAPPAVA